MLNDFVLFLAVAMNLFVFKLPNNHGKTITAFSSSYNLGVGTSPRTRSDQPSSISKLHIQFQNEPKGPHSTRAGEELREGEVYLDNVRIPMTLGPGKCCGHSSIPTCQTANEVAEIGDPVSKAKWIRTCTRTSSGP